MNEKDQSQNDDAADQRENKRDAIVKAQARNCSGADNKGDTCHTKHVSERLEHIE